jgi:hypothetical protein
MDKQVMEGRGAHLSIDSTIKGVLTHPAFAGFGRLILPWDDRSVDDNMPLRSIGSLLPYHTHVNPNDVVTALNRMIDDATSGKTIFYDFYTEAQKQADSTREIPDSSSSVEDLVLLSRLCALAADSPTSPQCTKAFHMQLKSTRAGITFLCLNTGLDLVER